MQTPLIGVAILSALAAPTFAQDQNTDTDNIEEIIVQGRAQTFYRIKDSSFGTKTNTDFLDIPQSVQVLSRQLIEDQAARQITDLYRSISGVSKFSYSGVTFRGFRQDEIRYDGVEGDPFGGFSVPQLFNIVRVEVLKGPSGMLYGGGEPGGLINYVTKKPQAEQQASVSATYGNYGTYGASGEYTGAINEAETISIRLGAFYEQKDPFRYNTEDENIILDAGISFDLKEETSLLLQATYVDQQLSGNRLRGVPVDDEGNFITDIRWNHNEKTDFQNLEALVLLARLKHQFTDALSANITFRYLDNKRVQNYHEPRGLVDLDGDGTAESMRREFRDQHRENKEFSVTADFVYKGEIAGLEHTLLFGGDYYDQKAEGIFRTAQRADNGGPVPNLDLLNPVYGVTSAADYDLGSITPRTANDKATEWGLYVQDQISLSETWKAVVGVRLDGHKNHNRLSGERFSDETFLLRGGLIYRPAEDVSFYASFTEGKQPQSLGNQDAPNGPFEPETSRQFEGGVKAEMLDGRVQGGVSLYQITKQNVLQADPSVDAPTGSLVSLGEVRSRGVEVDIIADITDNWVLTANYGYNDTKITDDAGTNAIGNSVGDRFANAPKHTFGLWSRYDFTAISSSIAGGMDYVSERVSLSGQTVKAYATFDASWQTNWRNLNFQLNVRNLFNKEYAESGFISRTGHFPGEPRTIMFQVKADF